MNEHSNRQGDRGNVVAIDDVVERWHAAADDEDRQFGLFAEPETEAGRALARPYKRGPGRPPGSLNRRHEKTVAFLLSRHRDPRQILLEMAEANPHDIAAMLGCSPFEAYQEKRLAALGVLPYVAQRQPLAISLDTRSTVYLTISDGFREVIDSPADAELVVAVDAARGFTHVIEHHPEGDESRDRHADGQGDT